MNWLYYDTGYGHLGTWLVYGLCMLWATYHIFFKNRKTIHWEGKLIWIVGIWVWLFQVYEWSWRWCFNVFTLEMPFIEATIDAIPFYLIFMPIVFFPKWIEKMKISLNSKWLVLALLIGFMVVRTIWIVAPYEYNYPSNYFPMIFINLDGSLGYYPQPNDYTMILNGLDKLFLSLLVTKILLFKTKSDVI